MPGKKRETLSFYCEDGDPMIADAGKIYAEKVFFEKWQECLDGDSNWDFKEMKKRLAEKPAGERWFVMKSVETFPAEDDSVPFVPGYIVFIINNEEGQCQAPRLCMKAAQKTPDMDEEAFMSDEIADMKDTQEWRALENNADVYVLCGKKEDTLKIKQLGFGGGGGFPASNFGGGGGFPAATGGSADFSFGTTKTPAVDFGFGATTTAPVVGFGTATTTPVVGFGTTAPAGVGFNFGAPAAAAPTVDKTKKRAREEDEEMAVDEAVKKFKNEAGEATPSPVVMTAPGVGFGAAAADEPTRFIGETIYPVLFTPQMVEDMRKEITAGMKIITVYSDEETGFKIKVKVDCDLEFAKKVKEGKHTPIIRALIEKKVLEGSDAFKALREEYQGDSVMYTGVEDHERMQKEFKTKRQALLNSEGLKKQVKDIEKTHGKEIMSHIRPILKARVDRVDHIRAMLTAINKEVREGLMMDRESVKVLRILPEKDSKGAHCAFRPCKKINKAVGAADECYPGEIVQINPLTGLPMPC